MSLITVWIFVFFVGTATAERLWPLLKRRVFYQFRHEVTAENRSLFCSFLADKKRNDLIKRPEKRACIDYYEFVHDFRKIRLESLAQLLCEIQEVFIRDDFRNLQIVYVEDANYREDCSAVLDRACRKDAFN